MAVNEEVEHLKKRVSALEGQVKTLQANAA
jgi:polyhydroxyalkanoate synthesis regulator phasin